MAKCWKCEKSGLFLQLSSAGLCMSCLEEAADIAVDMVSRLRTDKQYRKDFFDAADRITAEEILKDLAPKIDASPFSVWDASIHLDEEQKSRIARSSSVRIIKYDPATQFAEIAGSKGSFYITSFSDCTCGDFISRRLPCKHMYKIAAQYGGIDLSALSE